MKIAIILRGISFLRKYNSRYGYVDVDYHNTLLNYKQHLFEKHNVDVFFHTYETIGNRFDIYPPLHK